MEEQGKTFYDALLQNIRKAMKDNDVSQSAIASRAGLLDSQVSKIFSGAARMSIDQFSKIAKALSMLEIDLITYPRKYVPTDSISDEPVKAVLQIELDREKKDQIFKIVLGEDGVKLLNK